MALTDKKVSGVSVQVSGKMQVSGVTACWSIGVMECWVKRTKRAFKYLPQYSTTPLLQDVALRYSTWVEPGTLNIEPYVKRR